MGSVVSDRIKSYFRLFLRLIFGLISVVSALGLLKPCNSHPVAPSPFSLVPVAVHFVCGRLVGGKVCLLGIILYGSMRRGARSTITAGNFALP